MSSAEQEYLKAEDVKSRADVPPPEGEAASAAGAAVAATDESGLWRRVGSYRWIICGLLFFATTINYMDRQVLGILSPDLQKRIGWNEDQYGQITAAFQAAYALGMLLMGRLIDLVGTRAGYAISIAVCSLAAMSHALARSAMQFGICRFALGIGESGNFPSAVKTVAEWFPKRERALATGIFNSGANVGAVLAPLMVPFIALHYGWQWAFMATGAASLTWIICWLIIYRKPEQHPRLSKQELAYIQSDPVDPPVRMPWLTLLPYRQTWAFAIGKFLTDPVWWFWLFWLPKIFAQKFHLDIKGLATPLVVVYIAADFGSILGGYLATVFFKLGWSENAARKMTMLICALCVLPVFAVSHINNQWVVTGIFALACAAHQGWSANLFTTVSDMFPRPAVGSVVGFGGMFGALAGMFCSLVVGKHLEKTHNYDSLLLVFGSAYLLALLIIHLLVPRLQKAQVRGAVAV
jgi:ACS family hexuronate transporter-like MFS transporter